MIKRIYTATELQKEFASLGRDYFSYEGYEAMLEIMNDIDENYELDVIELCCIFTEYSPEDLIDDYDHIYSVEDFIEDNRLYEYDEDDESNDADDDEGEDEDYDEDEYLEALLRKLEKEYSIVELSNGNYLLS